MLYSPDGEVVRYDGVASGRSEIDAYYRGYLAGPPRPLAARDRQVRHAGDVLMWDGLLDSDVGVLQTIDVVILDDEGLIRRHIPGFRGYWGR